MRRLPPLKSLPDFEAAGRLLSFTRAAEELGITHGAVSRQVKALEDHFGLKLFRRLTRRIVLTEEGRALLPLVQRLLDELGAEGERLRHRARQARFTVTTGVSFAMKWLAPRLPRFQAANPELDLHLDVSDALVDLQRDGVEAAIRHGRGGPPAVLAERLFDESVMPVASPALLARRPLAAAADLARHTLLHEDRMLPDWPAWLAHWRVPGVEAARGPRFSHGSLALEAAIRGEGVALGRSVLVADDLAAGRLVAPLPGLALAAEKGFELLYAAAPLAGSSLEAFRRWLFAEAAATPGARPLP